MDSLRFRAVVLLGFGLLAASAARAGIELDPGTWQQIQTGSENGQQVKKEIITSCVSPEDARDPVKVLSALKELATLIGHRCKTLQVHEEGSVVSIAFECGEPKTLLIAINMSFNILNAHRYTGTVKSRFAFKGRETNAEKNIEAKWLGAECKEH